MAIQMINLEEQNIRRMTKRECVIERITMLAEIAAYERGATKFAAFAKLSEEMAYAVEHCGFTWEEVEAIEAAAYAV